MSDMQRPMGMPGGMPLGGGGLPGGPPGGGGPEDMRAKLQSNYSMFNPTDAAAMKGQINPQMTLRQFFQAQGYDVDRTTVGEFAKDQMQKAQPLNKMKAFAGGPPGQAPVAPMGGAPMGGRQMPPAAPVGKPDLGGIIQGMRSR